MGNKIFLIVLSTIFFQLAEAKNQSESSETLTVLRYDNLSSSLPKNIGAMNLSGLGKVNYQNYYAANSESPLLKKNTVASYPLATNTFEDAYSSNASALYGPGTKNTAYELLCSVDTKGKVNKEHFCQLAFLDSSTLVGIACNEQGTSLVFIDISGDKMYITSRLAVPSVARTDDASTNKELFFIDRETNRIFLPVNSAAATLDKEGRLAWKDAKESMPGMWIIQPVKNEEKKWSISADHITVRYFYNEALKDYSKNGIQLQTVHADQNGNIWLAFSDGIIGVLPVINQNFEAKTAEYEDAVYLYNFNKDLSLVNSVRNNFIQKMYDRLKNGYDPELTDTSKVYGYIQDKPQDYTNAYWQDARYTVFSNLVRDANAKLQGDETVPDENVYWNDVSIDLDNPLSKNKKKLYDYFNFKVRKFQTLQNGLTSGNDNSVYATTNLALYKLTFDDKKKAIETVWTTMYSNSFLKDREAETASSNTTPAFNADHNEVVIADNDFPHQNLLILDAKTGKVKNQFALFETAYGSSCANGIVFSGNTIVVANAFGNAADDDDKSLPATGIMKFSSTTRGNWHVDYDWNALQSATVANTAAPKISASDNTVYVYHEQAEQWGLSGIGTEMPKKMVAATYDLQPNFAKTLKLDLDNYSANFTIGPQKSIFIGTANGLLRIKSE